MSTYRATGHQERTLQSRENEAKGVNFSQRPGEEMRQFFSRDKRRSQKTALLQTAHLEETGIIKPLRWCKTKLSKWSLFSTTRDKFHWIFFFLTKRHYYYAIPLFIENISITDQEEDLCSSETKIMWNSHKPSIKGTFCPFFLHKVEGYSSRMKKEYQRMQGGTWEFWRFEEPLERQGRRSTYVVQYQKYICKERGKTNPTASDSYRK